MKDRFVRCGQRYLGSIFCCMAVACGGGGDIAAPIEEPAYSAGDIDLSRYVAIGDSLTAGYADSSLYFDGQLNSFPNILAGLFSQVGGGEFTQPYVDDNLGGITIAGVPLAPILGTRLVLREDAETGALTTVRAPGFPATEATSVKPGPYGNLGVAGAKIQDMLNPNFGRFIGLPFGAANPYFIRFASSPGTTLLADALMQQPTFFTLWAGNNDLLLHALDGANAEEGGITEPAAFTEAYEEIIAQLTAEGTNEVKGVLVNIPAIATIPYFTTVPFNPYTLDETEAERWNARYVAYNEDLDRAVSLLDDPLIFSQAEADARKIRFTAGQNAMVIRDETLKDLPRLSDELAGIRQWRHATAEDLILLPVAERIGTRRNPFDRNSIVGLGATLGDDEVLIPSEIDEIEAARLAYNLTITRIAEGSDNLAMMDAANLLARVSSPEGIGFEGGQVTADFITGGAFSLDGVHPTARGYSVVANEIIATMDAAFGSRLPKADPARYTDVFYEGVDTQLPDAALP